ncbi:MAG: hypothetical protein Q7T36_10565 [Fluviicoccus sp.]|uniref:hypothetical protein n=1 Tax=Fluviicoccus sp. TaxID=2003552 RepID=UPI002715ADF5|nr:hypothetical protein [Fluviicoccus sp.]MDO8330897.1 hypothetical protein [Fluviicoccus sp.]
MPTHNFAIAMIAEEHDKALVKSLLVTFGDRGDNQWTYTESEADADVVVVDLELFAQRLPLKGAKFGSIVVSYAAKMPASPPSPFLMTKPVRGREFVKLLERLEDVFKADEEDEFAQTQRRIVL